MTARNKALSDALRAAAVDASRAAEDGYRLSRLTIELRLLLDERGGVESELTDAMRSILMLMGPPSSALH